MLLAARRVVGRRRCRVRASSAARRRPGAAGGARAPPTTAAPPLAACRSDEPRRAATRRARGRRRRPAASSVCSKRAWRSASHVVLGVQRAAELHELLVRGEVALAHDRGRGDGEVHGVEQLARRARPPRRSRRCGLVAVRPRTCCGASSSKTALQQRAPQRQQVVALVEHDDAHAGVAQRLHALHARWRRAAGAAGDLGQLAGRDLPLRRARRSRATSRSRCRPPCPSQAAVSATTSSTRLPGRGRALLRARWRWAAVAQHALRVGGLAQRLVGQHVQVRRCCAPNSACFSPHWRWIVCVGHSTSGGHAEPADDLQADDRLARARAARRAGSGRARPRSRPRTPPGTAPGSGATARRTAMRRKPRSLSTGSGDGGN